MAKMKFRVKVQWTVIRCQTVEGVEIEVNDDDIEDCASFPEKLLDLYYEDICDKADEMVDPGKWEDDIKDTTHLPKVQS